MHKGQFCFYHYVHAHLLILQICTDISVVFLFGQILMQISHVWVLKLKFSFNYTCVSQELTTVVPANTGGMHACVTLVLCPESAD
jgi:hypothetical protein